MKTEDVFKQVQEIPLQISTRCQHCEKRAEKIWLDVYYCAECFEKVQHRLLVALGGASAL